MTRRAGDGRARRSPSVSEQEIIEGLKPVCVCKGIRTNSVLKHIRAGLRTVKELQRATGAGTGPCEGKRCTPRIEELLRQYAHSGKERGR